MAVVYEGLKNSAMVFASCTCLSMLANYIAQIRGKLSHLIVENLKLLD